MKKNVKNFLKFFPAIIMLLNGCSDNIIELKDPVVPQVVTASILKIEHQRAFAQGNVLMDGGSPVTARGFVWSLEPEPTLADNKTLDGDGFGEFVSLMTELQPDKIYYARAYATNSVGTAYGAEEVFRTRLGSVTDIDGNEYFTIRIGNRLWMSENLRVTRYANGNPIINDLTDAGWQNANYGAYAIYPHNLIPGLNSDEKVIEAYGLIYNWFVAADPRGVCPAGWRVPNETDWGYLGVSLGGVQVAGRTIKSKRTFPDSHPRWDQPNDATNASGWSALPVGRRLWDGRYAEIGTHGHWLSATERDSLHSWSRMLYHPSSGFAVNYSYKQNGNAIRCVKNVGSN